MVIFHTEFFFKRDKKFRQKRRDGKRNGMINDSGMDGLSHETQWAVSHLYIYYLYDFA
jgi:hypothetical protein